MDTASDRQPACGFCDGSGLWADADSDPGTPDPCPLCDGTGLTPCMAQPDAERAAERAVVALADVEALLPELTQAERQRLYELLHARYDCRIYR